MNFCLDLCIYMNNNLVVFWKSFHFLPRFLVKMPKKHASEDKWFYSKMFYQIKIQANTNWSSHRKKTSNNLFFSNDRFFTQFSKIAVFRDF